ncbi:putative histone h1 [Rhypophila decipiens]|uniref:Histone H1 n=1 Tax=Rhypophila decipiens TaxID=261697 RepID=A0AAN6YH17_9PEZI|nr:putative histone h1 [Rhypophila decipiens]
MPPKAATKTDASATKAAKGPSYQDMITDAIVALKERNGSSRPNLKKYVKANNTINVGDKMFDSLFNKALKAGVDKGIFQQPKGPSGSTKLAKPVKAAPAPKKEKPATLKAEKPAKAEKKEKPAKEVKEKKAPASKKEKPAKAAPAAKEKKEKPAKEVKEKKAAAPKKAAAKPAADLKKTKTGRVAKAPAAKAKAPAKAPAKKAAATKKATPKKKEAEPAASS